MGKKKQKLDLSYKYDIWPVYKRLLGYVKPYWRFFAVSIAAMIAYAATETSFAYILKQVLDEGFFAQNIELMQGLPFVILAIFVFRGAMNFFATYYMKWVGRRVVTDMRARVFQHMLRMPTSYYDHNDFGELLSRMIYHVEQVAASATDAVTTLVREPATIFFLLGYMFYLNWKLSLVFLLLAPILGVVIKIASKKFRIASARIQASIARILHLAQEMIVSHRVIKTYNGQQYETDMFEVANEENMRRQMKMIQTDALFVPITQLVYACAIAFVVYLFTTEMFREDLNSPGSFAAFMTAMALLLKPIKSLTGVNATLQKGTTAANSIFSLLDISPEPDEGTRTVEHIDGRVRFENITFRYERSDDDVLRSVTLDVESGAKVAIIGKSGSGKTTLVSLLPRLYHYTEGNIYLDDIEIRDLTLNSLRRHVAVVTQDVQLFNDTIRANIIYGYDSEVSDEQLRHVAESAHLIDFIDDLPNGFNTLIGDNGVLLSGGQRQRLSIARAILKDAPVLILDEATSALDTHAERHIQAALDELMENRTTIVIAHRLSTIVNSDKIVVMHKGEIVEEGTHDSLLAADQQYAALYKLQFRELDEPESAESIDE